MKQLLPILALVLCACTANTMAKNFGGSITVAIAPGKKLVTATWKDDDFWYLVRPMREGEAPEAYDFIEASSFGVSQGVVHLVERR